MAIDLRGVTEVDIERLNADERKRLAIRIVHTFEEDGDQLTPELESMLDDILTGFDPARQKARPWREIMDDLRDTYVSNV